MPIYSIKHPNKNNGKIVTDLSAYPRKWQRSLIPGNMTKPNEEDRFVMEIEFVQSLANPAYLSCKLTASALI
jgi:hypothetical protein